MLTKAMEIRQVSIFKYLSPKGLDLLAGVSEIRTFPSEEYILFEGDPEVPFYAVLSGSVRIFRVGMDGREQNLTYLKPGDAFNLPSLFEEPQTAAATAVAVGETRLLRIAAEDFLRLAAEDPEIAFAVIRDLSRKLHHLTALSHNLSLRSVRGRLARFLLNEAQSPELTEKWTHEKIAAQIGTVREVVSRTLRAFVREGLIEMNRQKISILDPETLRETSEE
jgi:CRP/FNR family transcriptional regulator